MSSPISPFSAIQPTIQTVQVHPKTPEQKLQGASADTVEVSNAAKSASAQNLESHTQSKKDTTGNAPEPQQTSIKDPAAPLIVKS